MFIKYIDCQLVRLHSAVPKDYLQFNSWVKIKTMTTFKTLILKVIIHVL